MSKQSIYHWPDYYDWTSDGLDHDVSYYVSLAIKMGGPVLELGAGTGRISLAIAREGIEVVGLDQSSSMLVQAESKGKALGLASKIRWVNDNMQTFQLNQHFPLIIIPYRSFLHNTTVEEQFRTLKQVHQHLDNQGLFVMNIFVPHLHELIAMEGSYLYRGSFPIPGYEGKVEVYDTTEYDYFFQTAYVHRYYERFSNDGKSIERLKTEMKLRYIFPTEMNHLLALSNFQLESQYGNFMKVPFDAESKELIIEARKKG